MAIEIPEDWPNRTWVEDTPLGHLVTVNEAGEDVRWEVANWESTREMTSAALPGQVRAKTGLSVGTGRALVKRQPDDFPWKQSLVYELSGQDAQILLAPEGRTEIPTGQFLVAETAGDLTTLGVSVDLDEKQIEGRTETSRLLDQEWPPGITQDEINAQEKDPVWWIAELAQQIGYRSGPNVAPGVDGYNPILDVPFQGALVARHPRNVRFTTTDTPAWGTSEGATGLTTALDSVVRIDYGVRAPIPQQFVITMDANDGRATLEWDDVATSGRLGVQVTIDQAGTLFDLNIYSTGTNGLNNTNTAVVDLDLTRNPEIPNRMQIEVTLTPTATGYNSASVRVQRETGEWTAPLVHAMANELSTMSSLYDADVQIQSISGSTAFLSNFSIVDTATTTTQAREALITSVGGSQGRMYLEPLVGTLISPWLDPEKDVWTLMQEIVEAWQGALITDVFGDLKVLNRFTLSGINNLQQERIVDVGLNFEDLPWVMNHADQADRLVVKYRPVVLQSASPGATKLATIYEFQEVIGVSANSALSVPFTLDYLYPTDLRLLEFVRKDTDDGIRHVWDAYRYNNGSGDHIDPNVQIQMRLDRVSTSTWSVYIRNLTAQPFHMVDETGQPYLKIRSSYWYDQTVERTIERGLSAAEAKNALEVDFGNYVQTEEDANALADYLWGRVNARAWRASTVRMKPDYRLDLGDVIEIHHARTGIRSNALVSKVAMAGAPGEVTQSVDLVLIPPTWEDFDEAWANAVGGGGGIATWNDFDELWDEYTWNDFDRTPTATTVAQIEEGK